MKKNIFFAALMMLLGITVQAQKPETVLFTVGNDVVTVDEFEYIYEKNNSLNKENDMYSDANLREYLNLYVNFKLKVQEAQALGLDTTEKFISEFGNYRQQLAQPYLNDKKVTDKLVDEAYERMKYELRARHILITVAEDAFPSDTLAAYNKALEAKNKIKNGESFESVAQAYSKDPSVVQNNGDIGFFTALQMVYPFENACYNAKVNELVGPVRSRFGYHIIEVVEKRPYKGEITTAHILIRTEEADDAEKQAISKKKIDELYKRLQNGEDFSELAKAESEHYSSAARGGALRPFNSFETKLPSIMVEKSFELENDGDFTKPFQSQFGWHIVKRISIKPLDSKEQMAENLKRSIERDSRSHLSTESAIARIKKENRFKEWSKNTSAFKNDFDSTLLNGTWSPNSEVNYKKKLFRIAKENYTQKDFAEYLQKTQQAAKFKNLDYAVDYYYHKFVDESVLSFEDKNLENKYRDFRNIVKEYREGILMFDITQDEVWSRAMKDTVGLRKFFNEHQADYQWKKRADVIIFTCKNKTVANQIKEKLAEDNANLDALYKELNGGENASNFAMQKGVFELGDEAILDLVNWKKGYQEIKDHNGKYVLVKFNDVMQPQAKKLSEIRGVVIAAYQDYLEKEWIAALKEKYPVVINEEAVRNLFK